MNRILSWRVRSASKMPFTPSPGNPKIVSISHSIRRSINKSATVFAISFLPRVVVASRWISRDQKRDDRRQFIGLEAARECRHVVSPVKNSERDLLLREAVADRRQVRPAMASAAGHSVAVLAPLR